MLYLNFEIEQNMLNFVPSNMVFAITLMEYNIETWASNYSPFSLFD